jgi:hypothetical protein
LKEKEGMDKGVRYKRQVLTIDMVNDLMGKGNHLDAEIAWYCKRVTHIAIYTKRNQTIGFEDCQLSEPLTINDQTVYPSGFDTSLLYPIPGSDCELHQQVNIPLENGARIKGRFVNKGIATRLVIVLQLETNQGG